MNGAKDFEVQSKHTKPAQDNRMSLWIFFFFTLGISVFNKTILLSSEWLPFLYFDILQLYVRYLYAMAAV